MDYVAICIAILLWLIRPQDWVVGLGGFGFMTWVMLAAIVGFIKRPGGSSLKQFFMSPGDYLVFGYLIWIPLTSGSIFETAKAMVPYAAFYYITAIALNTKKRLYTFLSCWVIGLAVAMFFAISTSHGFEWVAGSEALTTSFGGRLALNTWIFNNPNSLGHGIVALIPLCYLWMVWRRPTGMRVLGFGIIAGSIDCVILTASKGAYLCGAAAIGLSFLFRKPRSVQIFTVIVLMTAGIGVLKLLPRMDTLSSKEEGIAGRLLIWQMAYNAMATTVTGEGWRKFEAWIMTDEGLIHKATHGSYVNVGADLGYVGLFFFVGILYVNSRTLLQARPVDPNDVELERCHRALLSLTASFIASAWMIDRAYHTDFFILAGAVAAFHRLMTGGHLGVEEQEEASRPRVHSQFFPALSASMAEYGQPALAGGGSMLMLAQTANAPGLTPAIFGSGDSSDEGKPASGARWGLTWRQLGLADLGIILAATSTVIYLWNYLMTNFISF